MILFHRKAKASGDLPCAAEIAYEILTDYDSYQEWMPGVTQGALLAKEGELAIASLDFGSGSEKHVSLECIHTTNRGVLSRAIEGETLVKSFDWAIEPSGAGCRVTVVVEAPVHLGVSAGAALPSPKKILDGLASYASSYADPGAVADGDTLIEIIETERGLACWFNGRQYEMKPVAK